MRPIVRSALLPVVFVIAALTAACGGDDDEARTATVTGSPTTRTTAAATATADTSGGPFDICSVLTAEEAGDAIGDTIGSVNRQDDLSLDPPSYVCEWEAQGDGPNVLDRVRVEGVPGDQATLDDYYDDLADAPEVPDLGLRAHYDDFFGLEVMMDGYIVGVTVITSDFDDAEIQERTIELGRLIADRLPE